MSRGVMREKCGVFAFAPKVLGCSGSRLWALWQEHKDWRPSSHSLPDESDSPNPSLQTGGLQAEHRVLQRLIKVGDLSALKLHCSEAELSFYFSMLER